MSESPSVIPISLQGGTETWAEKSNRFLAECVKCVRPVALRHTSASQRVRLPCPLCNEALLFERLYAVKTAQSCDLTCMYAAGPHCSCGCGGANHGRGWETVTTGYALESALSKYRAIQEKKERKKERAQERKRSAFEEWVKDYEELVEALDELWEWSGTLEYLRRLIRRNEILTEAQLEQAADIIPRAIEDRYAREQELAAFERQKYLGYPGERVSVSGVVRKVRSFDKGFGRSSRVIVVECDGENQGVTVKGFSSARWVWDLEEGQRVTVKGVVKNHEEYNMVKETRLTNMSLEG